MFDRMTTRFDDTVVLEDNGVLIEKILLEYKTSKAGDGKRLDANVHERLSFQMMQYLEVATRFMKCSLVVISNGAFARYRNKYHPGFHVQADRLSNFAWFSMYHACTISEYERYFNGLLKWLFDGQPLDMRRRA
ncbi:MAG: hypothetical protein EXR68_03660 [Dehalococcoidia bacterium]|nr:hypothetical protein [Dehalococcoidia bacterium]